jgi:SAM-dependent methyltransferase
VPKQYDERYFDKWYRDSRHRVIERASLERRAAWVVATAEYVLGRPIRTVLDVACGEGHWAPVLKRLRPRASYTGVDPSPYVLQRFGKRRNIIAGHVESLDALGLARKADLVLCCAALNYLEPLAVRRGLRQIAKHTGGIAHVELFARGDPVEGDFRGWRWYSRAWVRSALHKAGLVPVGLHCYVRRARRRELCVGETT